MDLLRANYSLTSKHLLKTDQDGYIDRLYSILCAQALISMLSAGNGVILKNSSPVLKMATPLACARFD